MKKYILSIFLAGLSLMGYAQTASDNYLDIANYASIDDAGWNTSLVNNLYEFTEDLNNNCAWLTLPCYSAVVGAKYATGNTTFNTGHPQTWMETGVNKEQCGSTDWSENDVFLGSGNYFYSTSTADMVPMAVGTYSSKSKTDKTVTFYVTNTTAVKLYCNQRSNSSYPTTLTIYVCNKNSDGTLTTVTSNPNSVSKNTSGTGILSITNLEATTIYKVVASQARGYLYEIAFKTPLQPKLSATPTDLTFEYDQNQSVQETFTVTGSHLKGAVSMTLDDPEGVFSLSPNTITVNNNKTVNQEVTVTFNPGTTNRVYEGSVTLSSQGVDDVVVNLKALPNKIPVTISTYGVSTLYLDYPVEIPYDTYDDLLGVFYAHEYTENELKMARIRKVIPANEGVVVEGNAGTYEFPRYKEDDVDNYKLGKPNLLKGSVVNIQKSAVLAEAGEGATVMTLGFGKSGYVGFYAYSGSVLTANKAFLIYTPPTNNNSVNSLSISGMGGDYTGISEMRANHNDDAWYTLQGVRLNGSPKQHGIYIHNGKTVVVK